MSDPRLRFTRQVRLAEIGEAGQARLAAAAIVLGGEGHARAIEERYLRAAGVGVADDGEPAALAGGAREIASLFEDEAAREFGEGALRALAAMRTILGVGTS